MGRYAGWGCPCLAWIPNQPPPSQGLPPGCLTPHPSLQHFPKRFSNYVGRYIIISQQLDQCSLRITEIVIIESVGSVGSVVAVRGIFAAFVCQLIFDITHSKQSPADSRNDQHHRQNQESNSPPAYYWRFILADRRCDYRQHHANPEHHQGGIADSYSQCGG